MINTVTKQFRDYPAAHRQPLHDGHCRLFHGHNWGFDIVFTCNALDGCGFVIDVGRLQPVKDFLTHTFDHTLLLNEDDPIRKDGEFFEQLNKLSDVVLVPNCGMEGLAKYVYEQVNSVLEGWFPEDYRDRALRVQQVTCWEDSKNSATYL